MTKQTLKERLVKIVFEGVVKIVAEKDRQWIEGNQDGSEELIGGTISKMTDAISTLIQESNEEAVREFAGNIYLLLKIKPRITRKMVEEILVKYIVEKYSKQYLEGGKSDEK